jgi:hypothetical protein
VNLGLASNFIARVAHFLFVNLPLFFAAFMFFGYSDYLSKRFRREFWIIAPVTTAIGIVIVIWVGVWLLNEVNLIVDSAFISRVANFLSVNLLPIFVVLLVLGYVIAIAIKIFMMVMRD